MWWEGTRFTVKSLKSWEKRQEGIERFSMKTAAHIAISIALVFSSVVHNETRTQATSLPFAPFAPLAPATTEILPYASGTGYVGSEAPGSAGPAPINCNAPPYTTAITELDSQKTRGWAMRWPLFRGASCSLL